MDWSTVIMKVIFGIIAALSANQFDVQSVNHELHCLQKNVYFEARNQSFEGMRAVATVTLNRYAQDGFPNKICEVVHEKTKGNVYQFSWVAKSKPNDMLTVYRNNVEWAAWIAAGEASLVTLFFGGLPEVGDAQYFHATSVNPRFHKTKLEPVTQIGDHIFYRIP